MSDFLKSIVKEVGNEYASIVEDGDSGDVSTFIDTGSHILNGLLSGNLNGGLPANKIQPLRVRVQQVRLTFLWGL